MFAGNRPDVEAKPSSTARRSSTSALSDEEQHRRMMEVLSRTESQLQIEHDKIYAIKMYERSQEAIDVESRLALLETVRRAKSVLAECQESLDRLSERSASEEVTGAAAVELERFYDRVGKVVKGSS